MAENSVSVDDMKRFLGCFNTQNLDGIMEYMAEDAVFIAPTGKDSGGRRVEGAEAIRAYFAKIFENVPDVHFGEDLHWVAGDFGVSEWTLSGTQPDGSPFAYRGTDHFRFSNGKIVLKDTYQKVIS